MSDKVLVPVEFVNNALELCDTLERNDMPKNKFALKCGYLVNNVRQHAEAAPEPVSAEPVVELEEYDAGYLNDFGGGNVGWWQDYIRSELGRAHDFYQSQVDNTPAAEG